MITQNVLVSPYSFPGIQKPDQYEFIQSVIHTANKVWDIKDCTVDTRRKKYIRSRFWAMWVIRKNTTMSYNQISKHFLKKHHTSIMHGIKTVNNAIKGYDPEYKKDIETANEYLQKKFSYLKFN